MGRTPVSLRNVLRWRGHCFGYSRVVARAAPIPSAPQRIIPPSDARGSELVQDSNTSATKRADAAAALSGGIGVACRFGGSASVGPEPCHDQSLCVTRHVGFVEVRVLGDARDGLGTRCDAGLLEDGLQMAFDRVLADVKAVGDCVIRESFGEECRDLALADGQSEVVAGPTAPSGRGKTGLTTVSPALIATNVRTRTPAESPSTAHHADLRRERHRHVRVAAPTYTPPPRRRLAGLSPASGSDRYHHEPVRTCRRGQCRLGVQGCFER